jgi:hypothetical protein
MDGALISSVAWEVADDVYDVLVVIVGFDAIVVTDIV